MSKKTVVFIVLSFMFNFPSYSLGKFGGIFSDTLNFTRPIPKCPHPLTTGKNGNLTGIDGKLIDINEIHLSLKKSIEDAQEKVEAGKNIVAVGLTLVVKYGDKFEAFYSPFKPEEDNTSSVVFISGSVAKLYEKPKYKFIGPSDEYNPLHLLQKFKERINQSSGDIIAGKPQVEKYYTEWDNAQKECLEVTKKALTDVVASPFDSVYDLKKAVDAETERAVREANSNFGSSVDSEQFLLAYLTTQIAPLTKSPPESRLIIKYKDLVSAYRIEKAKTLKKKFISAPAEDMQKMKSSAQEIYKELDDFEKIEELGCILHLHSTNEICCCCAYSLAQELLEGALNMQIKEAMKSHNSPIETDPFFLILTSASQPLISTAKRQGIGQDNKLPNQNYEAKSNTPPVVKINEEPLLREKLFLQYMFPPAISQSPQSTSGSSSSSKGPTSTLQIPTSAPSSKDKKGKGKVKAKE